MNHTVVILSLLVGVGATLLMLGIRNLIYSLMYSQNVKKPILYGVLTACCLGLGCTLLSLFLDRWIFQIGSWVINRI